MNKKEWYKPPIKCTHVGCVRCPETTDTLALDTKLINGFGGWSITKNGNLFFVESDKTEWEHSQTLSEVELMIGDDNESDYRAVLYTPLRGATYQRQGKNNWVLIETNEGFA